MTARPYLNQWDPTVARRLVGRSSKTMQAVGCCVTAVAQAIRKLGVDGRSTGVTVMANALAAWDGVEGSSTMPYAVGSAAAFVGRLGQGNGVVVHDLVERTKRPDLIDVIVEALKAGHPVLLPVDKNGDPKPDHWLCALALDDDHVIYADPDGGVEGKMRRDLLEGYSLDGKHRYRVTGCRVVTREA